MRLINLVLFIVLVIVLIIVVLQNMSPWHVRFLWFSGDVPGIILLLLAAVAGGLLRDLPLRLR